MKDTRLNFYGQAYVLPPDKTRMIRPCDEAECIYDYQCHGNRRCCKNTCGASVCTEVRRDPHPCALFNCPLNKVCKLQRVRCIHPDCPDLYAIPRPVCITENPNIKRAKVFNSFTGEPFAYIYPVKPFYHQPEAKRDKVND